MDLKKLNPFHTSSPKRNSTIFQLVSGTFGPGEAADVLLSLVNYKIKFHSVQLLNLPDNEKAAIEQSEQRIAELKIVKQQMTALILDARKNGQHLEINSDLSVTLKP